MGLWEPALAPLLRLVSVHWLFPEALWLDDPEPWVLGCPLPPSASRGSSLKAQMWAKAGWDLFMAALDFTGVSIKSVRWVRKVYGWALFGESQILCVGLSF